VYILLGDDETFLQLFGRTWGKAVAVETTARSLERRSQDDASRLT